MELKWDSIGRNATYFGYNDWEKSNYPRYLQENIGKKITQLGIFLFIFKINLNKKIMASIVFIVNMLMHSFLFISNVKEGVDTLSYLQ